MKLLFKLIVTALLLLPVAILCFMVLSIEQEPKIANVEKLTTSDVRKARIILSRHNPKLLKPGQSKNLELDSRSLSLAANYLLQQTPFTAGTAFKSRIQNNLFSVDASIRLAENPVGRYLNISASLDKQRQQVRLHKLQIGPWLIPDNISRLLQQVGDNLLKKNQYWQMFEQTILDYQFIENNVLISYRWQTAWERLARQRLGKPIDNQAIETYARTVSHIDTVQRQSFSHVLSRLFILAAEKPDPAAQNRTVFLFLAHWALGNNKFGSVSLPPFDLKVHQRLDLAQHFLVSAAISSHSDSYVSNLFGTSKELQDAVEGSGFSFADIAADRAGTLLGKEAVSNNALKVQLKLSLLKQDSDLIPLVDDLPASLSQQEFREQFGDIQDIRYKSLIQEIDNRINSRPFFKD